MIETDPNMEHVWIGLRYYSPPNKYNWSDTTFYENGTDWMPTTFLVRLQVTIVNVSDGRRCE